MDMKENSSGDSMCVGVSLSAMYRYKRKRIGVSPCKFVNDIYKTLAESFFCYLYRNTTFAQKKAYGTNKYYDIQNVTLSDVMKVCRECYSEAFCQQVKRILLETEAERKHLHLPYNLIRFDE
jgi:hypothetical protein